MNIPSCIAQANPGPSFGMHSHPFPVEMFEAEIKYFQKKHVTSLTLMFVPNFQNTTASTD